MSVEEQSMPKNGSVLRFGIMCDGQDLEQWQADCVQRLLSSGLARLELLIIDNGSCKSARTLAATPFKRWLYTLYRRTWFSKAPRKSLGMKSTFDGVATVQPDITLKGKFSQLFDSESLDKIRSHELDFILRFGFNIIRSEILNAAGYGVWSFHHGDEMKYRGSPAGLWEIYSGDPVTGAILQRLTERLDGGIVLKRGYLSTVNHSYIGNIQSVYEESANWPAQVCRDILNGNAGYFEDEPSRSDAPIYFPPGNVDMLRFFWRLARNRLREYFRRICTEYQWNIGRTRAPIEQFLDPSFKPSVEWLPDPPKGKFYADPFPLFGEHKDKILFERFDYREGKADIACGTLSNSDKDFKIDNVQSVIAVPTHLSYPSTFEHEGSVYCIPESYQANSVTLYRDAELPYRWEKVATLIHDMAAVDATVFHYQSTWWMMCSDRNWGSKHNLFIFHADDLLGPWKAHERNPVKTDVRSSRPAGAPFIYENSLYRPAQDCSWTYGGQLVINRIEQLSSSVFVEKTVAEVPASAPYGEGLHSLTKWGDCTLLDGKRSKLRWIV